ncbi:MAG: hypothetical protein AAB581_01350 [Patescibacteria group bacterium]
MLTIASAVMFFASLVGIGYLIMRRVPALVQISPESLPTRETFFAFCARMSYNAVALLKPQRIKIYVLSHVAAALNKIRMFSLRVYYIIEAGAKKARQESQKMEWEHRWFSADDGAGVNGKGSTAEELKPVDTTAGTGEREKTNDRPQL